MKQPCARVHAEPHERQGKHRPQHDGEWQADEQQSAGQAGVALDVTDPNGRGVGEQNERKRDLRDR